MATAGYPYISNAIKRILNTDVLPSGVYPSIDPDTYEGWYDLIIWQDETIEKPSKERIKEEVDLIKLEREASGASQYDMTFDVII